MIGFVNAFCIFIHGADGDTDQRNNSYSTHLAKLTTPTEKVSGSSIGVIKISVNTINNHIGVFVQRFDDFNPIIGVFHWEGKCRSLGGQSGPLRGQLPSQLTC